MDLRSTDLVDLSAVGDRAAIGRHLDAETATVRVLEPRADAKAGTMLSLSTALLAAALAPLFTGKLSTGAAVAVGVAACLLGGAVALVMAVLRPNVGGNFGFSRWARMSPRDLLADLAGMPDEDSVAELAERARQLVWLTVRLERKFARLRAAQVLVGAALAAGMVAAGLAAAGW